MSERTAFPLSWPDGWKRTKNRRHAHFNKTREPKYNEQNQRMYQGKRDLSVADAVGRLLDVLARMGVSEENIIISTNLPLRLDGMPRSDKEPADPGAAVYWQKVKQAPRCMAIDQYWRVADNIAAIAATLEAMRAIERHGGATILDRAFLGFAALPERATQHWRETPGIQGEASLEIVDSRFRALSKVHHPDVGGDSNKFQELVQARDAAKLELAG